MGLKNSKLNLPSRDSVQNIKKVPSKMMIPKNSTYLSKQT
eukprot:CAMPEP_0170491152 /NCGR_PEP_ID=MMETSP0208-20121228/10479_1 /TAXON_ID=197538 /ORGANISM="Strombidium inclinatum, Strain S3" /LENGTH=39 /DNA_ID= /DNA_START= /DNA_END= /DNA_ORIENTATION=